MEIKSLLLELMSAVAPLLPVMLFAVPATLLPVVLLYRGARNIWVDEREFRILGLFYGLNGYDCWRLSLSWVRFLMTVYYVAAYRSLELQGSLARVFISPQFAAYLIVGVLYVLDFRKPLRIPKNILWFSIISLGLFAVSLISDYMRSLSSLDGRVLLIYICMGIFMCLFALYLFLLEAEEVSGDRKLDPEKDYGKSDRTAE